MKQFKSSSDDHAQFNGVVHVLRPLTYEEADLDDVGPMFRCKTKDGVEFTAFGDELEEIPC